MYFYFLQPGLVATLVPDPEGETWGVGFHLVGQKQIDHALDHLGIRECSLGGYSSHLIPFYPQNNLGLGIHAMVYYASPHNNLYVGSISTEEVAKTVVKAVGSSGHNVEYVIRTAEYVRENIPKGYDSHLKTLEETIRDYCFQMGRHVEELIKQCTPEQDWTLLSTKKQCTPEQDWTLLSTKTQTSFGFRRNSNRA